MEGDKAMPLKILFLLLGLCGLLWSSLVLADEAKPPGPDFNTQVVPIFKKYCNGCHNADEKEGGLILESFDSALKGSKRGAVIVPGKSELSRLVLTLEKKVKPVMPPEGNEGPKADEIAVLKAWIDAGAKGPSGQAPDPTLLVTPKIATKGDVRQPIQAVAWSRDGKLIAVARHGRVELLSASDRRLGTLARPEGANDAGGKEVTGKSARPTGRPTQTLAASRGIRRARGCESARATSGLAR